MIKKYILKKKKEKMRITKLFKNKQTEDRLPIQQLPV